MTADGLPGTSRQVLAGGLRWHALEAGAGPPLLLLHGTAIDSASLSYGPSLPHLAAHHRVLAPDWPGYGRSEVPRAHLSIVDSVALLGALIDAVGLERVHLAGFSMGGAVALGYALTNPERVRSLSLVGSYGLSTSLPVPLLPYLALRAPVLDRGVVWGLRRSRRLTRLVLQALVFSNPRLVTSRLVADVHEQLRAPEAERSFVAWLRGEIRPFGLLTGYAERLGELRAPTLLLHGRNDRVIPYRAAERAAGRIPHVQLEGVPRCGHWVPREAPEVFRSALLGFAQRC
jgi:pimeloyl-ACP methyl ester carboxylesterase